MEVDMYCCLDPWLSFLCFFCFNSLSGAWSIPETISQTGYNTEQISVAVDPNGNTVAVWQASDGSNQRIQSASKPFGGTWSAFEFISETNQDADSPQVVIDPNGNAVAVWHAFDGFAPFIKASSKTLTGSWTSPATIYTFLNPIGVPHVAMDANGNALVVWETDTGINLVVYASTKTLAGSWTSPVPISSSVSIVASQVAMDANGNSTAVWRSSSGGPYIIQAATRSPSGTWSSAVDLSAAGQNAEVPQIAMDPNGNATAVWRRTNGTNWIIQAATKTLSGTWTSPVDLSADGQDANQPQVSMDPNGNATAVWMRNDGVHNIIQASTKPFGENWPSPSDAVNLSPTNVESSSPQIAVDVSGNAPAVWGAGPVLVQAKTKLYGGSWQTTPDDVSQSSVFSGFPQIGADAMGNVTVVFINGVFGNTNVIQATTKSFGPTVTHIDPNFGPTTGGTAVTITGTNFTDATAVNFGSTPASSFTVVSPTTIIAIAPPGTGTVDITVTVSSMTSPTTSADQYTYQNQEIAPPTHFKGKGKHHTGKLFLKTSWKKSTAPKVVRYEIFARNTKLKTISAKKSRTATIHLHPHHVPHHLSKDYRLYLHNKYKIRAVDSSGQVSSFTWLHVKK